MPDSHVPQPPPALCAPALRWVRTLPGTGESVRQARRWPRDFLPSCEAEDDLETIIHELVMNAVQHTASGQPGGTFTMDLSLWHTADFIRLVIGDQGGDTRPRLIRDTDGDRNRGLLMVDGLSARWGITGNAAGRWIWADIPWTARGGLLLAGHDTQPVDHRAIPAGPDRSAVAKSVGGTCLIARPTRPR